MLMQGRRGLVLGVANKRSLAWAIAKAAADQGAQVGLSYYGERLLRRVKPLAEEIDAPLLMACDVADDAQLDALFAQAAEVFEGRLDFVVHAAAFAQRDDLHGAFTDTSRAGFGVALDVSAYSLVAVAQRAAPLMAAGGNLLALTYYGAEKVVEGYNVMGPAKAALEASVRYLAADLGPKNIRVNALSAGPVKTLSSAGIPGIRDMLRAHAETAPLRRNVTAAEVGNAGLFLLSGLASAVTGEVLHVDAGSNILGR